MPDYPTNWERDTYAPGFYWEAMFNADRARLVRALEFLTLATRVEVTPEQIRKVLKQCTIPKGAG